MEEEPKKGSESEKISEVDALSNSSKSKDAVKDTSTNKPPSRRFRDFLVGSDIDTSDSTSSKDTSLNFKESQEKTPENRVKSKEKEIKDAPEPSSVHDFHLSQEFMKFKIYRDIRSNKEKVIQIIGGIVGVMFILAGILYLLGSAFRVADNVVFGERAVLSAFLMLVGVLIIAGFFARKLLSGTFLKNIHTELEEVEEQPSKSKSSNVKEKSSKVKKKQKDNIEEKDKK